ncbi:MAG TPA: hypothetical protein VM639_24705 [Dongiaceae bacterium]|nr:hypothetical protein [Dongiaceae bacterium]
MPDVITVLAGGWSAGLLDLARLPGFVIGVNDSAIHARCDHVVSMDRLWTEHRAAHLAFCNVPAHIRGAALKNVKPWPALQRFDCDHRSAVFSDDPGILNGTNSGLCAFNLAYQMRPKQIFLVGFDMQRGPNGEGHWFQDYSWAPGGATKQGKYNAWAMEFHCAGGKCSAAGIEVLNIGERSLIDAFPKINSKDFGRYQ